MPIRRNDKQVPNQDLASLISIYEDGTDVANGSVVYSRIDPATARQLTEILPDAFIVTPDLERTASIALFRRALIECRLAGPITPQALMQRAQQINANQRAVPAIDYTLWTKFRASSMAHNRQFRLNWDGVRLRTESTLPRWLDLDEYFLNGFGCINPGLPQYYGYIIGTCSERLPQVSADRIIDAIQLATGLLNLYEGFGRWSFGSGRARPEGRLWLGPYQFLFQRRTSLAGNQVWYDPDHDEEAWTSGALNMNRILPHVPRVRRALEALQDHPLRASLQHAILIMQDGFAARDGSLRLLKYWSALERLYVEDGAKEKSNQKVIERAAFAEHDPRIAKWTLSHIARIRNDYVHSGEGVYNLDAMSQYLKNLLARHINYWIFNGNDFSNHSALLQFVSLPSDPTALQQLRSAIDRRLALNDQNDDEDGDES